MFRTISWANFQLISQLVAANRVLISPLTGCYSLAAVAPSHKGDQILLLDIRNDNSDGTQMLGNNSPHWYEQNIIWKQILYLLLFTFYCI